jgi:dihydropyrimidinase
MKTLVTNGTVATATEILQADILIEDGRIVTIDKHLQPEDVANVINAASCYVIPGGIDVHTHVNLSVGEEKVSDGFFHGSIAAAHGGTTCIVEHPGFGPAGCALDHQIRRYQQQAEKEIVIDYGLHAVIQHVNENILAAIKTLPEHGIPSLKVYLTYSGRLTDEEIIAVLTAARKAGVLVTFHAENHAIVSSLTEHLRKSGRQADPASHPASRPDYAEAEAIYRLINLARAAGEAPIYIVHLSTAAGLALIQKARKQGREVYAETCPQYLCLTEECYREPGDRGLQYIMSPPLRTRRDRDALWEGLADGTIDVVATDHCSFSFSRKKIRGKSDVFMAPGGIPGVETRIPLLFSEGVVKKRIELNRFVELISTNPARIMGLAPQKGALKVGADADLIILDPSAKKTISPESLHQHVDYTPFTGMLIQGWPKTVMQRGEILVRDGKCMAAKGDGNFIQRLR